MSEEPRAERRDASLNPSVARPGPNGSRGDPSLVRWGWRRVFLERESFPVSTPDLVRHARRADDRFEPRRSNRASATRPPPREATFARRFKFCPEPRSRGGRLERPPRARRRSTRSRSIHPRVATPDGPPARRPMLTFPPLPPPLPLLSQCTSCTISALRCFIQDNLEPGEEFLRTLNGDFLSPSLLSSLDLGAAAVSAMNAVPVTHAPGKPRVRPLHRGARPEARRAPTATSSTPTCSRVPR